MGSSHSANRTAYPLSIKQQRLWFLERLGLGDLSSGILQAIRLDGTLKVDLLRQAFDAVVSRHWSLHTAIAVQESEPVQIIVKHEMAQLQLEEMSRIQERRSEEEFVRQEVEAIRRPFDLAQGPLLRASLLRLDDNRSILLMAIHPIISDKTSMRIVLRELADSYENLLAGRPPFLGGLPSQYVDFALWQRQWLQTEQSESHLRYWKRRLRDSHGLLELPTDRPRPAMQSFRCVRHSWSIPQSLYESVNDLSQRQGTPLFATLLALFQTLLLRCTGQEDIVVGISIEARRREEALDLIGPLVNWAALRTDLSGNPSFLELLERVREVIDGAYAHQEMPFEKLVEELQLERSLSHAPLFQVMFELQDEPQPTLALPDLKLSYLDIGPGRSEIDLTLSLVIDANGMSASFEYNTDLFDQTTIARLALHYQNLLEGIVANPGGRLADLPMLTERQRHQILVEWNENRTAYPEGTCIHQLFEDQVDRTPDKLAVQHGDRVLSYAELNRRANQLAHYLIGQGVKPEVLVGICALRSLEMVIGLIGILKAGGAYVPLDPAYPQDRLSFMLQDSGAEVLLTQESLLKRLPRHKGRIVCLDTLWESIAGESGQNIISKEDAENLAYVIYTSGSTGKPKGVAIQHRSSVAFLYWARGIFGPEQFAGILASTSICFDLSIFELFFPLCWGGKVILAENVLDLRSSPAIREVSLINTVPSAIAELVRVGDLPASVHTVNLAGEPLQNKLAQQIYRQSRARQVFNLYGPTEDTTYSTFAEVRRGADTSPSIGRPIDNTAVYLLDRHLHPVPVGIKGELYIGGSGLARGYLNHPDLTAEKFIPNPFGEQGGTRLYKTGDLARYLVDGNIEFLGRADKQVKLRGYRIELGEVETMLAGLPNVRESVVTVDDRELAEKCLVAYVVPERGQAPTSGELRRLLKEKLPEYMVPTTFFFLDALPLTPNGKVDRRALPRPQPKPELESSPAAPSTPTEEILAGIWSDVLRPRLFGIHEDFFDLGGHSLLAMRVMARIQEAFQVEIPLRMLFEAPTIEGLAVAVDAAMAKKVGSGRIKQGGFFSPEQQFSTSQIPAGPVPRKSKSPVPLSFAQQRLWFFDQLEPGKSTYHIPAVFRLAGLVQLTALEQSLGEIVRRHEVLRTVFRSVDGNPLQVVTPAQGLPFTVIDLEAIPESDRLAVCRQRVIGEVNRPFDLSKDYLLRASLLHLGQVEHILVLTLHHIAADGWSIAILLEELTTLYKAYSEGRPSPLEELPIQYADFALWQRERLQGVLLESELTYWTRQLQGTPSVLELPIDHIRTTTPSYRGARESIILTKDVADSLKALSQQQHVTLFTTMLAAFGTLLHRYTAQTDLVIGIPMGGRNSLDTEKLIGFFLNTLPLRVDLSGKPTFPELMRRLHLAVVEALSHQELPFDRLVEELHPVRTLSHAPIFQVMLNVLNLPEARLELEGLEVEPLPVTEPGANFDLTLYVRETQAGLELDLVYAMDLFEESTMHQFSDSLRTLLLGIVANPDRRLSRLPILEETERRRLASCHNVVGPSNSFTPFQIEDTDLCIPSRFEQQVKRHPFRIAVKTRNIEWTYDELNTKANQVRQAILRRRGQGEEQIGLLFDHDAPMIAAILGVLKSGKTYVPLDPTYPMERLSLMVQDSQVSGIVSTRENGRLANQLAQGVLPVIDLDELHNQPGESGPLAPIPADSPAYILYTSGSTGRPKGVVQNHRNVLHHIRNYTQNLHIASEDRLTLLSSYSFDAAVMDIYGALLNGASLYPFNLKEGGWHDLAAWLKIHEITIYHSTPTVYRYFLDTLNDDDKFPRLRLLVLGGEEVESGDVELFRRRFPKDCLFVNGLGPTESTLALQYFINFEIPIVRRSVPVGYPVDDTEIHLLNEDGEDGGVYGEIAIRSPYLASGYWRKPELTSNVFLPDPEGRDRRIYRTGDMGRLLPDGSIEFAGRKDFQIKLRGFRIEPGEIEAVLSQHPAVQRTVVLARDSGLSQKRLVAYVVPKKSLQPSIADLGNFLKMKLPSYMVPAAIVLLDGFPLTPNGKVDRKVLPEPIETRLGPIESYVAPSSPIEKIVAEIWSMVLGLERIGVHDNFFDLGGHSLLATQAISHVRDRLGIDIPLRSLFAAPTVAGLALEVVEILSEKFTSVGTASLLEQMERYSEIKPDSTF